MIIVKMWKNYERYIFFNIMLKYIIFIEIIKNNAFNLFFNLNI